MSETFTLPNTDELIEYSSRLRRQFLCDLGVNGMLYGSLVYSPISHGKVSISLSDEDKEQCVLVDYRDIPCRNAMRLGEADVKVFSTGNVMYKGECLALVLSSSAQKAKEAASRCVLGLEEDVKEAKCSVYCNTAARKVIKTGLFQDANSGTLFTEGGEIFSSKRHFSPIYKDKVIEGAGALCAADKDTLTVICPTQSPSMLKKALRRVLGKDVNITVQSTKTTRQASLSFDYRIHILALQAAVASFTVKKSVYLMLDIEEEKRYTQNGVLLDINSRLAVKDCRITALHVSIEADIGAYNGEVQKVVDRAARQFLGVCFSWYCFSEEVQSGQVQKLKKHKLSIKVGDLYEVQNVYIECRAHTSSRPPTFFEENEIDEMVFRSIESLMLSITGDTHHYMLQGISLKTRNESPVEAITKAVNISDFCRKQVAYSALRRVNEMPYTRGNIALVCGSDENGEVFCAVVETEVNEVLGTQTVEHIWIVLEASMDESETSMSERVYVAVEKDVSVMLNTSITDGISCVFAPSHILNGDKRASCSIEERVHCLFPAVIDAVKVRL